MTKGKCHSRGARRDALKWINQSRQKSIKAKAKSYDRKAYDGNDGEDPPRGTPEFNNRRR